uniref:IBP2 n=1 Tax=Bombyx mori TaxID=7091 RepID=I7B1E3_BOMMO|nr:IBP2 [Bombyx mori]
MISIMSAQLVLVALVSLQCGLNASAIDSTKLDNSLSSAPSVPKRRVLKNFAHISQAPPDTVHHTTGSQLELECLIIGKPAPIVEWLKNGEPIEEYEEATNEVILTDPESFAKIVSKLVVVAPTDGDRYTCAASAGLKRDSATTTVYTDGDEEDLLSLEKLLFKPIKPTITLHYSAVFQNIGTDLLLPCRVFSYAKTQVYWQYGDNNLVYETFGRIRVLPSGDLYISGLKWSDMGNYTCVAKNIYGKDTGSTFIYPVKPSK